MKKKSDVLCIIDKIVWWFIALFPLFVYWVLCINNQAISMNTLLTNIGFNVTNTNIIYTGLNDIFGSTGNFLQLFASADFIAFATYFVTINLIHLVIDLMLFMVDICHEWLKGVFRKW